MPLVCYVIGAISSGLLASCATSKNETQPQFTLASEVDDLKTLFNSKELHLCKNEQPILEAQGRVQNAKLFWNEKGEPKLIYQAAFRDEVKSVFQPLETENLGAKGDGIRLGPKSASAVVDFEIALDDDQNTWASYRYQPDDKSPFMGTVEFVEKNSSVRRSFKTPIANDETTVTKIWTLGSRKKGQRHVIVRTSRIDFSKTIADSGIYILYRLDIQKAKMIQVAVFKNEHENLESATFLLHPQIDEPVAFGIEQRSLDEEATTAAARKSHFRIVATRIFSPRKERYIVNETADIVSQLDAAQVSANEIVVAWLREQGAGEHNRIEWAMIKNNDLLAITTTLRSKSSPVASLSVDHTVNNIAILDGRSNKRTARRAPWLISWQALSANHQALQLLPANSSQRAYATYTLAPNKRILSVDASQNQLHLLTIDNSKDETNHRKIADCTFLW